MRRPKLLVALALALTLGGACALAAARPPGHRRVALTAPAQHDFALAEVLAPVVGHRPATARRLRVTLPGPTGLDYVAAARVTRATPLGVAVLVVSVNRRPQGSLAPDLASIALDISHSRALRAPRVLEVADPISRPRGLTPALCNLPGGVSAAGLRPVLGADGVLSSLTVAEAVAAAYDTACGAPADPRFRAAVTGTSSAPPATCPPCYPSAAAPGRVCPLIACASPAARPATRR